MSNPFQVNGSSGGGNFKYKTRAKGNTKTKAELKQETDTISLMMQTVDNPARNIPASWYSYFGVRHAVQGGKITKTYYPGVKADKDGRPYVSGYKERVEPKEGFYAKGDMHEVSLFGAQQALVAGSSRLFITAGEEDAIALAVAIMAFQQGTDFEGNTPAVVSLPYGDGNLSMTKLDRQILDRAKEIILIPDQDESGRDIGAIMKLLPAEKVKVVDLPMKDASEMWVAGKGKDLAECALFRGKEYRPATIVGVRELLEELTKPVEYGMPWPWPELDELTYGIRPGKIYGVGGGVGSGKTQWCHAVIAKLAKSGHKVGALMLEETSAECLRDVAGLIDRTIYNRPDKAYDTSQLVRTAESLQDNIIFIRDGEIDTVEQAIDVIKYMVFLRGAEVVIVDPVSALVTVSASEANERLTWFFKTLEQLAVSQKFAVIATSHLNPPKYGVPHEEGGAISLSAFTGSRALMRKSSFAFGLERNSKATNGLELYNRLVRLKSRGGNPEARGEIWTKFNVDTGRLEVTKPPAGGLIQKEGEPGGEPEITVDPAAWGAKKKGDDNDDVPW